MLNYKGELKERDVSERQLIATITNRSVGDVVHDPEYFVSALVSRIDDGNFGISGINSGKRTAITAKVLSKRLRVPLELAREH